MPSMKRVKERRLSTPVRPCHHNQSGSLRDILDCQIRKAFEITYFGSFQSHAYASIVFALHLSIEARAADQLPATGPVRHLSIDGFSATRFGWRKAGKPVGWLGLMVASGAGCCTAWPLDTDKQNKPSRLLRTLGSWGDAGQRRLSDINSSRLHDLIASYTMQHPDWQQSIRQPGGCLGFSRRQPGRSQSARHCIAIGWIPYSGGLRHSESQSAGVAAS